MGTLKARAWLGLGVALLTLAMGSTSQATVYFSQDFEADDGDSLYSRGGAQSGEAHYFNRRCDHGWCGSVTRYGDHPVRVGGHCLRITYLPPINPPAAGGDGNDLATGADGVYVTPTIYGNKKTDGHYGYPMSFFFNRKIDTKLKTRWNDILYRGEKKDEQSALTLRYWIKFDSGINNETTWPDSGYDSGKLPGLAGTRQDGGGGFKSTDGTTGWSARIGWYKVAPDSVSIAGYLYYMNVMQDDIPDYDKIFVPKIKTDEWHYLEMHVGMNSFNPLNDDGEFWLALDGVKRIDISGDPDSCSNYHVYDRNGKPVLTSTLSLTWTATDTVRINQAWFDFYWGGACTPSAERYIYIDEICLDNINEVRGPPVALGSPPKEEPESSLPIPALAQNAPNPFSAGTTIQYMVAKEGLVALKVYNTLGQEVRSLVDTEKQRGCYQVPWDGRDNGGVLLPSGIYLYRLRTGKVLIETKKLLLLR